MKRETEEVKIRVSLGERGKISTGDPVLDHMLKTLFFYMGISAEVEAQGDLRHHLWEDVAIVIGKEISSKYDRNTIARFGEAIVPMDDALVLVALDISRGYLNFDLSTVETEEGFSIALIREFFSALSRSIPATIHVKQLAGFNAHHVCEAAFKALGMALKRALQPNARIESTKGEV
ncbi:MAG: imidazoleglycerol-phosphate dehydratase HisB [Thermotogae bacterium]|nr:imidazoleglycerol-phosphate dehydratase HisB [Thermotogota bacterium]